MRDCDVKQRRRAAYFVSLSNLIMESDEGSGTPAGGTTGETPPLSAAGLKDLLKETIREVLRESPTLLASATPAGGGK